MCRLGICAAHHSPSDSQRIPTSRTCQTPANMLIFIPTKGGNSNTVALPVAETAPTNYCLNNALSETLNFQNLFQPHRSLSRGLTPSRFLSLALVSRLSMSRLSRFHQLAFHSSL